MSKIAVIGSNMVDLITYIDRMPAQVWFGRPDVAYAAEYCETQVYFAKKTHKYTPSIEGSYWFGLQVRREARDDGRRRRRG